MVYKHYSDRSTGYDHVAVAKKEEAEHVVHLVEPKTVHDEDELNENGTER